MQLKVLLLVIRYLKRDNAMFTFEGEKLNEDIDLEEGKIIEVHIKP